MPLYVVWAVAADLFFDSAGPASATSVPVWMVVGFVVCTLAVSAVTLWYLVMRASGKVSEQRHHTYMAILVAVIVSGFASDAVKGLATLSLGGHPWWVLVKRCSGQCFRSW